MRRTIKTDSTLKNPGLLMNTLRKTLKSVTETSEEQNQRPARPQAFVEALSSKDVTLRLRADNFSLLPPGRNVPHKFPSFASFR